MKRLLIAFAFSCYATLSHADNFIDGENAYRAGDYAKALRIFQNLSAGGNAIADHMLSLMYANGNGVTKDSKKSQELALQAIERGNDDAYGMLARMNFLVNSDLYDPAKGMEWLQKGVKANDANSMRMLAWYKATGQYTPLDKEGAVNLLKQCTESYFTFCTTDLAEMYEKGVGVQQSYPRALRLYQSFRADDGSTDVKIGQMYEDGHGVSQNYSRAMEYYVSAAKMLNGAAMNRIGELYLKGLGVQRDYMQAAYWFQKAANYHNADGLLNGGNLFASGLGVKHDDVEAETWYLEAVEKQSIDAMRTLARFYEAGRGEGASPTQSRQLFCEAAVGDQSRMLLNLSSSILEPAARRDIVGELAVLYQCKESASATRSAGILEARLNAEERAEAQALAGTLVAGSIGKSLDAFTAKKQ